MCVCVSVCVCNACVRACVRASWGDVQKLLAPPPKVGLVFALHRYAGNRLLQKTSTDQGSTWGSERDMTAFIQHGCNSGPGGQVCGAAGSRLQTLSGRLVFSGHNDDRQGGGICVWYVQRDMYS